MSIRKSDFPNVPTHELKKNHCAECQKFSKVLASIQNTIKDTWGDTSKHLWVLHTYIPGAIKVLTDIAGHCEQCVADFNRREKGFQQLDMKLHFADMKTEKAERDRHQHIADRCHQVLAKLEGCRHYGKDKYYAACVEAIKNA